MTDHRECIKQLRQKIQSGEIASAGILDGLLADIEGSLNGSPNGPPVAAKLTAIAERRTRGLAGQTWTVDGQQVNGTTHSGVFGVHHRGHGEWTISLVSAGVSLVHTKTEKEAQKIIRILNATDLREATEDSDDLQQIAKIVSDFITWKNATPDKLQEVAARLTS